MVVINNSILLFVLVGLVQIQKLQRINFLLTLNLLIPAPNIIGTDLKLPDKAPHQPHQGIDKHHNDEGTARVPD